MLNVHEILSERRTKKKQRFLFLFMFSCFVWVSGIERLQVVQTAIGRLYVSGIDRQQSGEAATGYVLQQTFHRQCVFLFLW